MKQTTTGLDLMARGLALQGKGILKDAARERLEAALRREKTARNSVTATSDDWTGALFAVAMAANEYLEAE